MSATSGATPNLETYEILTIVDQKGAFVRSLRVAAGAVIGFHPRFGFIAQAEVKRRLAHRTRRGLKRDASAKPSSRSAPMQRDSSELAFAFQISADGHAVIATRGCEIAAPSAKNSTEAQESPHTHVFQLASQLGQFVLRLNEGVQGVALPTHGTDTPYPTDARKLERTLTGVLLTLFVIFGVLVTQMRRPPAVIEALPEPVVVTVVPEKRVVVPKLSYQVTTQENRDLKVQTNEKQVKRAIQQDLGFLGLLGRKDLKKALGGMPTDLKNVSPGAGAGGNAGSGGELLVGVGQGVHRTTVGNTGVAGLGGIGTKGAGGGAGGYGNSMVGSGEGKGLTSMPLSDEMVLEGGLDRIVIQATIAKYISQVRACYEQGLKRKPGLNGQVGMQFEVGPSGRLNYSRVGKSTLGDAEVEQCIATRMMGWQFPKPLGGVNVKVNYPFLLRPVSS